MPIPPGEPPEYMRPENEEARQNDGLPNTETDTDTSDSVAQAHYCDFEMVPRGLIRTLKRDALSSSQFGLLTFLILSIDHKTLEYANRLSAIGDEFGWEHGEEYLRQCLAFLRTELWIDYEMKPGSRGPYVIRMGPRYFASLLHGTDLRPELSPDLQLTSNKTPPLSWR